MSRREKKTTFVAIGALRVKTYCILQELDEAEKSYKAGDMSASGDSETSIPDVQEQDDDGKTGVIKFRINQDFLIEHSCILHIRSKLLLL